MHTRNNEIVKISGFHSDNENTADQIIGFLKNDNKRAAQRTQEAPGRTIAETVVNLPASIQASLLPKNSLKGRIPIQRA